MLQIHRYEHSQMRDLNCPIHVITDLEYCSGFSDSYSELLSIDRHGDALGSMISAIHETEFQGWVA